MTQLFVRCVGNFSQTPHTICVHQSCKTGKQSRSQCPRLPRSTPTAQGTVSQLVPGKYIVLMTTMLLTGES